MTASSDSQTLQQKAKQWADDHQELLIILFVLPIGFVISQYEKLIQWRNKSKPEDHDKRVQRVVQSVKRYQTTKAEQPSGTPYLLRTGRHSASSLNTRMADKSKDCQIEMGDLNAILGVDHARKVVRVEPLATTGDVAKYLDDRGLQMEVTIEMKGATIGGLVLAIGMTTHSHVSGLMHDIVEAYELVTANGDLIRVEREGEHADLFRALPWSHGTLGLLVAMELRVVPATKYVHLVYRPFNNIDNYIEAHQAQLTAQNPPFFLEGQVFGPNQAVLIEGHLITDSEAANSNLNVNDVNAWYNPFFYKHVESMLEHGQTREELVPTYSYLMRHERSMCMTMGAIIPTATKPWFYKLFGWLMPPNLAFMKNARPEQERENVMRTQVYQDFAFPYEHFSKLLKHLDSEFEIYPLLIYPCKVEDKGGMVRLKENKGKDWSGKTQSHQYMNLGIYGYPKPIREGNKQYPTVHKVREIEGMIRDCGGFLHTYVDIFSTQDEFETMFDHTLWHKMREQYGCEGVFPTIYNKVKPELDPLSFLDEEKAWMAEKH